MDDELLVGGQSALADAKVLHGMVLRGTESIQEIHELIAVPPKLERILRAYMRQSPEDSWWIERSLKFRQDVLAEFDRLVLDGAQTVDLREVEETASEPFAEAMTFAQA
jgi:hypothetical protein